MADLPKILLSPSKAAALGTYFSQYPGVGLPCDVLVNLLLYPELLLAEQAFGTLWSVGDVEERQWKRAFEDVVNMGAIRVVHARPLFEQELILTQLFYDHPYDPLADLLVSYLQCERSGFTLSPRQNEIPVASTLPALAERTNLVRQAAVSSNKTGLVYLSERPVDEVARWVVEVKIPSIFKPAPGHGKSGVLGSTDELMIAPDDLAAILKNRTSLSQLRQFVRECAESPNRASTLQALAREERKMRRAQKIGELTVLGLGITVEALTLPFIHVLSTVFGKVTEIAGKPIAEEVATRRYHWLTMMEKVEARLEKQETGP